MAPRGRQVFRLSDMTSGRPGRVIAVGPNMQIIFECPRCQQRSLARPDGGTGVVRCSHCDWQRDEGGGDFDNGQLRRCRVCGCDDLWRQKDFPPSLGLLFVGLGIVFSSVAWAWHRPIVAIAVLMGFAVLDLILFAVMPDMLVCYRCRARHRRSDPSEEHPGFDLETAERYRQQSLRQSGGP